MSSAAKVRAAENMELPAKGFRCFAAETPVATHLATAAGDVACFSNRSPAKETANEDALGVVETAAGLVLVVADGMGGQASGEQAARLAVTSVIDALRKLGEDKGASLRAAILNGIEAANQAIIDLAVGAGATLAVAEVVDRTVRSYHVGDAAILLTGQRGKVKFVSISHSPVGYAEAAGIIDADEALHHEDRHYVSNFVGSDEMRIDIGPAIAMSPFDSLLLASDGLTDNLLLTEMVDVTRAGPLSGVAHQLAGLASERMATPQEGQPSKPDDLTFVVFRPTRN